MLLAALYPLHPAFDCASSWAAQPDSAYCDVNATGAAVMAWSTEVSTSSPLFLQFYCFALVRLSILCAHWYQQDVHEASGQFFGGVPRVIKSPISYPIDKTSEVVSDHAKSFCLAPCSWRSSFCLVAEVEKTGTSGDDSGTWGSFHHCRSLARLSIFAGTNAFWIWSSLMLRA